VLWKSNKILEQVAFRKCLYWCIRIHHRISWFM